MSTTTTTVIEENAEGQENNQAPPEKILDMAQEFGALRERYGQTESELMELKSNQATTAALLQEALSELRALREGQARVETELEQAELEEEMEEELEEDSSGVIEITPPMETSIQIEQKPVMERNLIQRLMYGNR
jgi:chromosome segregation ATPase